MFFGRRILVCTGHAKVVGGGKVDPMVARDPLFIVSSAVRHVEHVGRDTPPKARSVWQRSSSALLSLLLRRKGKTKPIQDILDQSGRSSTFLEGSGQSRVWRMSKESM